MIHEPVVSWSLNCIVLLWIQGKYMLVWKLSCCFHAALSYSGICIAMLWLCVFQILYFVIHTIHTKCTCVHTRMNNICVYIYTNLCFKNIYILILYIHMFTCHVKNVATNGWFAVFRSQDSQGDRHVLAASDLWSCGIVIYVRKTQRLGGCKSNEACFSRWVVSHILFNVHFLFGEDGPNLTSIFFQDGLVQPTN